MGREEEVIKERLKKLGELKEKNINPYPHKFDKKNSISECLKSSIGKKVKTAGRITKKRDMGKIAFCDIMDSSGSIQLIFSESILTVEILLVLKEK